MRKILITGISFLILLSSLLSVLLFSSLGFHATVALISSITNQNVKIDGGTGRLFGQWQVEGLRVQTPGAVIRVKKLSVDWHPIRLLRGNIDIAEILFDDVKVKMIEQTSTATDSRNEIQLPDILLPFAYSVNRLQFDNFYIFSPDGHESLAVTQLFIAFSGARDGVSINKMSVQFPGYKAALMGSIQTRGDWSVNGHGTWQVDQESCSLINGSFGIGGHLEKLQVSLSVTEPEPIEISGSLTQLLSEPTWDIKGAAGNISLSNVCIDWPATNLDLKFHTGGNLSGYQAELYAKIAYSDFDPLVAEFSLFGNEKGLIVKEATMTSAGSKGSFNGQLSWSEELSWEAVLSVDSFDFSPYQDITSGSVDLDLTVTGKLTEGELSYEADFSDISARLDDLGHEFTGTLRLIGDKAGIEILSSQIEAEDGFLRLHGKLDWGKGPAWEVLAQFQGIDPSRWAELPGGDINMELLSSGHWAGDIRRVQATVSDFSGMFSGYPLQGGGVINYFAGNLEVRDLSVESGPNKIAINGTIEESYNLEFMVDGQDISGLSERAGGQIIISGSLVGPRENPAIDFSAGATEITFQDYRVEEIELSGKYSEDGNIEALLDVTKLHMPDTPVKQFHADVFGTLLDHTFALSALSDIGDIKIGGHGQLDENRRWSGTIQGIDYVHPEFGNWKQKTPAEATASKESISLDDLCVKSPGSKMCIAGSWSFADSWQVSLSRLQLALSELTRWGLTDLTLDGEVTGGLTLYGTSSSVDGGTGKLSIPELQVEMTENPYYDDLRWLDTECTLGLSDQTLKFTLESTFRDGSPLSANVSIGKFADLTDPLSDNPLEGRLQLGAVDLSLLQKVTGDMVVPSGWVTADIGISGTSWEPYMEGNITLGDGKLLLPDLGINLSEIALTVDGDKNRLNLELMGRSGEGPLTGDGAIIFQQGGWSADLTFSGQDVQLADLRELQLTGNPDVHLKIGPKGGSLTGTLKIPEARIEPEEIANSDSQSRDTVFVNETEPQSIFPFRFDLAVELGDDIRIDGYGFTGFLLGNVNVTGSESGTIRGRGKLRVHDGSFSLRNRLLDISRGIISFNGGPVDNPSLDIQAVRTIKQERPASTNIIVGVNVTGNVQDYHLEFFSIPRMEDRDILAYMLMDRPFRPEDDSAVGLFDSFVRQMGISRGNRLFERVGGGMLVDEINLTKSGKGSDVSLIVGRRVTDRLTVSYDFNLYENAGHFRVIYSLQNGFSLEMKNSVDATGVELLYSLGTEPRR